MEKLTDTCYYYEDKGVAIVMPEHSNIWIVISKAGKYLFSAKDYDMCENFVKDIKMKKHATSITGFDTLNDAAQEIGKLRYDALSKFLECLAEEMSRQQVKDRNAGKRKLAGHAGMMISELYRARTATKMLFDKYKCFMKEELDAEKS